MLTSMTTSPKTQSLNGNDFRRPIDDRYFEDYTVGEVYEYGYRTVTQEEIIAFAKQFDPQSIHTDPVAAMQGPFSGIIASGWHSAGILMRLFADHYLSHVASLASPGIDELRWTTPLRPADELWLRTTIIETRPSRSKFDRGVVTTRAELINAENDKVMSILAMNILQRRN